MPCRILDLVILMNVWLGDYTVLCNCMTGYVDKLAEWIQSFTIYCHDIGNYDRSHHKKNSKIAISIGNGGRNIRVVTDWIQNIHNYGHARQSDKNGIMNFAEYN